MSELFLKIVNMSISAGWLVLAVLLLRLALKKAPKWVSVLLWGFVAVRLVCPFSIESMLSLIPSAETISPEIMVDPTPEVHTGITVLNNVINPVISESFAPAPQVSANPLQIWIPVAAILWLAGATAMLLYTGVSYALLRRKVATAVLLKHNIFQSEHVASPFVLGVVRPRIYLPFRMDSQNLEHVIAHEQAHIRRKDHWWKPLGFLLLALHWFNPLMWLGYLLLCRDIELACDEKVIREMDSQTKADYTQALVACSVGRRSIAACPLAFGEVGVKARVKSVLHYKKPALWIMIAAVILCIAVAVCLLTDPLSADRSSTAQDKTFEKIFDQKGYSITKQETKQITLRLSAQDLPESIYSEDGCEFEDGAIVAYDNGVSKVYLKRAMYSNEGTDQLYFAFEFAYDLAEHGGRLLYPSEILSETGSSPQFQVVDKVLRTDNGKFEQAVATRGQDGGRSIWVYVSTEALEQIDGAFEFDIRLNQISYVKDSVYKEGPLGSVKARYPEYFGLDASKGLDVYVWQMAENSYSFGLLPHSEAPRQAFSPELMALQGVEWDMMRGILSTYEVADDKVYVIPWQNPLSSYIPELWVMEEGEDPEVKAKAYVNRIRKILFPVTAVTEYNTMVAKSGDREVPLVSLPEGTPIGEYVASVYWLTIEPDKDALVPFTILEDGEEKIGHFNAFDTETFQPIQYFVPSGLSPQTYLFQNADPAKAYIVLATFSAEPDAQIYAFGARFPEEGFPVTGESEEDKALDEAIKKAILDKNAGDRFPNVPSGLIHGESHHVFASQTLCGTHDTDQGAHAHETTVYIQYVYQRYHYSGEEADLRGSISTPAVIIFTEYPENVYTVKDFWEPNPGSNFEKDVRSKFPESVAEEVLNPTQHITELPQRCWENVAEYLESINAPVPDKVY